MRATISFEADVDQVNVLMGALAKQEADRLREVAHILSTAQEHEIGEKLSTGLEMVQKIAHQLIQYKDMLVDFERAKFETTLPQPADTPMRVSSGSDARQVAHDMEKFDSFLGRINEESADDVAAQEG